MGLGMFWDFRYMYHMVEGSHWAFDKSEMGIQENTNNQQKV